MKNIPREIRKRIYFTVYASIIFLVAVMMFLAFYPTNLTIFQGILVILSAVLVLGGIIFTIWVPWGFDKGFKDMMEWADEMDRKHKKD